MISFGFAKEVRAMPKIYINIGCLLDVPTASFITGAKGETVFNGGLGQIVGVVGAGNNFKSTLIHYMMLSAANKIKASTKTALLTYDTEMNISFNRLEDFLTNFKYLDKDGILGTGEWTIVDKSKTPANEFGDNLFEYMDNKVKDTKDYITLECFIDPYSKQPMKIPVPTFVEIDSFTEFEAASVTDMLSGDLDNKDTNTYAMKQGNFKTKFLSQLPARCTSSSTYLLVTAHTGDKVEMGQPWETPSKKLQHLKTGDAIKSVGSKFSFLTNTAFQAHTGSAFYNQGTKAPEYPKDPNDVMKADLNKVTLTFLRNKTGPSGVNIDVLISQVEGVLPTLTEFHFLRQNKVSSADIGYGISGSSKSYSMDLYPNESLSRTTVRSKIDNNPRLARAINITAEMLQLSLFHPAFVSSDIWCTPKELYEDIKKLGYDWDKLLDTRGYWVPDQYKNEIKYLNTIDLLKMRKGLYHPWWYDKKSLKDGLNETKAK